MAKLITGIQGSGKSYKAMHEIATSGDKYYRVYSNLDKLINTRTIFSLDFNSFVTYGLKECFKIMVTNNKDLELDESLSDEEIFNLITSQNISYDDAIEYLQKIKVLPSVVNEDNRVLMIIDEAQDYFGKTAKLAPELLWFITQHRHLYIEIILLTQDISLIRPDYKLFNEIYVATPPIKQVDKRYFSYHQYAGLPIGEANYVGKIKLKREQQIFAMYKSGDKVENPNIWKRFIYMFIGAGLLIVISLYMLMDSLTGGNDVVVQQEKKTVTVHHENNSSMYVQENSTDGQRYLLFNCFSDSCSNKELKIKLGIEDLKYLVDNTDSKFLATKKYSSTFGSISLLASQYFINLFQGANNGKKDTQGFSLIN